MSADLMAGPGVPGPAHPARAVAVDRHREPCRASVLARIPTRLNGAELSDE